MTKAKIIEALNEADALAEKIQFLKEAMDVLREEGGKAKLIIKSKSGRYDYTAELNEKLGEECLQVMVKDFNERLSALSKEVESYISGKMEV